MKKYLLILLALFIPIGLAGCETIKEYAPDSWVQEAFDSVALEVAKKAYAKYTDVIEDNLDRLTDAQRSTYEADKAAVGAAIAAAGEALNTNDADAFEAQSNIIRDGLESMRHTIVGAAIDGLRDG